MVVLVLVGRRISPLFPGAFVGAAAALLLTTYGVVTVAEVGHVPNGLPTPSFALPWSQTPSLLLFGVVIALVGFAEAASIARRYASEDRVNWYSTASSSVRAWPMSPPGVLQGYPAGGSFSRSSLNRLSGARTRWSGVLAGVVVLALMPVASVLSELPQSALAGLIIAAALPLDPAAAVRRGVAGVQTAVRRRRGHRRRRRWPRPRTWSAACWSASASRSPCTCGAS